MEALNVVAAFLAIFSLSILLKSWFETKVLKDEAVLRLVDLPADAFKSVQQSPTKADAYRIRWWRRLHRPMSVTAAISTSVFVLTSLIGW